MLATLILGGGPAGTAPLVWAARHGVLEDWLAEGVMLVERGDRLGGTIGRYVVRADSPGTSFLECIDGPQVRDIFASVRAHETTLALEPMRQSLPPLNLVGRFLQCLGARLAEVMSQRPNSGVLLNSEARALHVQKDGSIAAVISGADGRISVIEARSVVTAIGGRQSLAGRLDLPMLPEAPVPTADRARIMASDEVLTEEGLARAAAVLTAARRPKVLILGGMHSAFSVAWLLLERMPRDCFAPGDIMLLMRRSPPIFYPSREEAAADGYAFTEDDICPATRRVNRLGGLRGDGRELWRRLSGRPGTRPEPRVSLCCMDAKAIDPAEIRRHFEEAALIVPAFGYRAAMPRVFDAKGERIDLASDGGLPAVDRESRLLTAGGGAFPNIFAAGLGTGFRPWGHMGGEASFRGQQNSLWLFQHEIGGLIFDGVRAWTGDRRRAA